MPPLVTLVELREAIADAIADNEKAYDVPTICNAFGLAPGDSEEAFTSKRGYVRSRIIAKSLGELVDLGEKLLERYPDTEDLVNMIKLFKATGGGVAGHIKNLIFAADGPKPELVLTDALTNTIEIVENAEHCLVYDLPISQTGLLWKNLVEWWSNKNNLPFPDKQTEHRLFYRLKESAEDRKLRLLGYEVYRFSGYELEKKSGKEEVHNFFNQLFDKHRIQLTSAI